jgi:RND family efflux transporter MFP subunit
MRFLRQSLTGLFLLSLTVGLLFYAGYVLKSAVADRMAREAHVPPARERLFTVNVRKAEAGREVPVLTAYGQVQSRRLLDLRSAVSGEVIALSPNFVEGGQVKAGELLLEIDPANAKAALGRAQTALQDAKAEEREAVRALALGKDELSAAEEQAQLRSNAFERQKDLRARGVGTDAAVETAELAASAARATVLARRQALAQAEARVDQAATSKARAEIALDEAQRTLADTQLRAAFSGTLSGVDVVEGRLISANEKLAQLVDADALEVVFRLSTGGYARLLDDNGKLTHAPVTASLDVYGVDLVAEGEISRDSAVVGEGQTGRIVFADLDAASGLKPGDFVTVKVREAPLESVVRLPASALGADGDVLVVGDGDRLDSVKVELLHRQGDDVLLRAPEIEGRDVVLARTPLLGQGIRVKPLRIGADETPAETPELLELSAERRAKLVAFVEGNTRMPAEMKTRLLAQLAQPKVPAQMVRRIEGRMGG